MLLNFFEYLKIRVIEYLADNEAFILKYSNAPETCVTNY